MKQVKDFMLQLFVPENGATTTAAWSDQYAWTYIGCHFFTWVAVFLLPLFAMPSVLRFGGKPASKFFLITTAFFLATGFLYFLNRLYLLLFAGTPPLFILFIVSLLCGIAVYYLWRNKGADLNKGVIAMITGSIPPSQHTSAETSLGEKRFKSLVQEGGDLIAILDNKGNYQYVSPTSLSILGISPEEFRAKNAFEFIHADDVERLKESFLQLQQSRRIKIAPYRFRHREGNYLWIETVLTNLMDDPAVNGYVANSRDVSDLLTASQKIRDTEDQYADLVKNLPIALYTCDTQGRILLFNKAACDLWGRTPEAGKDMWCGSWQIFNADGSPLAHEDCPMAIALKEKRPVKGTEILIRCPNGREHYVLPYPSPLFNKAGELTGALNVLIDITERKNIYARLVKTEVDIRNFAKQQNNLLEDERSRIAREIHDEFGQQLAGIKMSLSTLVKTCQNGKSNLNAVEMMQCMIKEVDNTMHSLRKFATELRPGILDTLGLVASIEWLAEEFEN